MESSGEGSGKRSEDDGDASGGRVAGLADISIVWLRRRIQKPNRTTSKVIWTVMPLPVTSGMPDLLLYGDSGHAHWIALRETQGPLLITGQHPA